MNSVNDKPQSWLGAGAAWAFVTVILGYGLWNTLEKAAALFLN